MDAVTLTIWMPTLALVVIRLGGVALLAPTGGANLPLKLRIAFVLAASLAVLSRLAVPAAVPADLAGMLAAAAGELLIGAVIGLAARTLFAGVQLGAWHVSQQMGLSLGEVFDPQAEELGHAAQALFGLLAIVIFLAIGGHRAFITAVLATFDAIPPASPIAIDAPLGMIAAVLTSSFALALQVAAPVLVTMLLAAVALGLVQKTLPQCNLLTTHLPVRAMLGLLVLAASLGVLQPLMTGAATELAARAGELAGRGFQ